MHIGTGKTGTKSLQQFLHKNRLVLAKKGILYPRAFGSTRHYKLAHYVMDFHKLDPLKEKLGLLRLSKKSVRIKAGLMSEDDVKDFRKEIARSFQKEIQNTNCTKLLISTEGLGNLFIVNEIQFLKKFLDDFVNEYTIIVYLRSQHERAISGFSTRCGLGSTNESFFRERFVRRYNYEKLLGRWSNVFRDKNIIPRIFSRKELLDGDIKKDFVSLLGWNWNDFEDIEKENESMSAEAQKFLLEINKILPRLIGNKVNKNRGNIGRLVSKNFKGKGLLPTRQEAENFFKKFKDSNEKVRQKWFPEKKALFEVDFDKYPEKKELFGDNFEKKYIDAFEIFAKLLSEKQEQIHHRKERLEDKKHLQEQADIQQSKLAQLILNREQYEKQIISEKKYTYAFEVFAKVWSEKQEEIRHLKKN